MFYCDDCAKKKKYPIGHFKSYGPCEMCGKTRNCNDILSNLMSINLPKDECQHQETVAINEEGHAGVYCVDCGEQLEKEC